MPETPSDALRAIADHLDAHGVDDDVSVVLHALHGPREEMLHVILDGAEEVHWNDVGSAFPTLRRDFGRARLLLSVPRELVSEPRTTTVEELLTSDQLIAKFAQQRLEVAG